MGPGAIVPNSIETAAFKRTQAKPDPLQNGVRLAVVRLRTTIPPAVGLASLQRIAQIVTRRIDADLGGGTFVVLPVQQPAEIVNYRTMGHTPALLAAALALGAVVALGLTLIASVRRRRRDLALLKTLGFTRRQLVTTVASQATVAALIGTLILAIKPWGLCALVFCEDELGCFGGDGAHLGE
jgi:ABC-type antimicrobial peptide transport system permease subunit